MAWDVFISHSSKDKPAALATCAALESVGVRCWIAPRDLRPGIEYAAGIIEGLESCRLLLLIFSANANVSPQIHREIERAINKGVTIIPFRIEDIHPTLAMEYYLGSIHWLDALTPPLAEHISSLAERIKTDLAVNPIHPPTTFRSSPNEDNERSMTLPKALRLGKIGLYAAAALTAIVSIAAVFSFKGPTQTTFGAGSTSFTPIPSSVDTFGQVPCASEAALKSPREPTSPLKISFRNDGPVQKTIYWINRQGGRQAFGLLSRGQSITLNTSLGHPWLVASAPGSCESIYVPTSNANIVLR